MADSIIQTQADTITRQGEQITARDRALIRLDPCGSCVHTNTPARAVPCRNCGKERCAWEFDEERFANDTE